MKEFPERVRLIRGSITQADFANSLEIPLSTLGRYERGETKPDISFLTSICSKYGVSLNWLVMGIGDMYLGKEETDEGDAFSSCKNFSECLTMLDKASDRLYQSHERERELLQEKHELLVELSLLKNFSR